MDRRRRLGLALLLAGVTLAGRASATGQSRRGCARLARGPDLAVPHDGRGAAVGASFLLASFVTDRSFIAAIHDWRREFTVPGRRLLAGAVSLLGVAGLAAVIVIGFLGPDAAVENAGYLLVWVGWWAGFTMTTYLVGNWWPALNPWRTIAGVLPVARPALPGPVRCVARRRRPDRPRLPGGRRPARGAGRHPDPARVHRDARRRLLGGDAFGRTLLRNQRFDRADPVSRVFRYYGRVAPVAFERATDDDRAGDDAGDGRSFRLVSRDGAV